MLDYCLLFHQKVKTTFEPLPAFSILCGKHTADPLSQLLVLGVIVSISFSGLEMLGHQENFFKNFPHYFFVVCHNEENDRKHCLG